MTINRRSFLKAGAMATSASMVGVSSASSTDAAKPNGRAIKIAMSGYPFEHVMPLITGKVGVEGCEISFKPGRIGDLNTHVFSGPQTLGVTEIGLAPYMLAFANEGFRDYSLVPVFPLRFFRHKSIFVNVDSGIRSPADLRGKRVGTPGYSTTSLTWIRGMLQDEYGVGPGDVEWVLAADDSSAAVGGAGSKQENVFPEGLRYSIGPAGKDESDLLVDGDVDALFHAVEPRAFTEGHPQVARLFGDPRAAEQAYFAKTGIFPIMHAVAVRKDLIDEHPWLPKAVFEAYSKAKAMAFADMQQRWFLRTLPWFAQELTATTELMGENFFPYGIGSSRKTLNALFRYSHEQGLASRRLEIGEMFEASTLELSES